MALTKVGKEGITGISNSSNANAITIDSSERVGIGTSVPTELLHLNANNPEFAMQAASDGGECAIYFKDDDGNKDGRITYRTDYAGQTDNYMQFFTNGSERLRVLGGGGITFNGDTAAANALSDYEEGTFEPTFTSSGGDFTSAGYNADTGGRYIKIGNLVLVTGCARLNGTLDKSNVSGSANLRIGNLPFNNSARSNGDNADGPHTIRVPVWSSGDVPDRSNMNPGANAMTLYKQNTDNNVAEVITVTDLPSDAMVQFSATYTTN